MEKNHSPLAALVFCAAAGGANVALYMAFHLLGIPLFMDTLFTVAATFLFGPLHGCLAGVFTALVYQTISAPQDFLYVLCSASGVGVAWFFQRHYHLLEKDGEHGAFHLVSILLTLSLYTCILMSVSGGFIAWLIPILWPETLLHTTPVSYFKLGMFLNRYPVLLAEIISRFPVNIPDRLLSVYGAYGLALLLRKSRFFVS
ncbi:MAG: hypothetical protein LBT33_01190 [Spirochaetia bacterium]|jgi:hypothetical protein|nr:hypothetical protein [Spirochaetia bacterium]